MAKNIACTCCNFMVVTGTKKFTFKCIFIEKIHSVYNIEKLAFVQRAFLVSSKCGFPYWLLSRFPPLHYDASISVTTS